VSVLLFLLIPVVVIAIGSGVLVLRTRKPQGMRSSVESFQREMKALSPDDAERNN
jgi:cytochrome c-type biogenesis protein CcmH/NrfF